VDHSHPASNPSHFPAPEGWCRRFDGLPFSSCFDDPRPLKNRHVFLFPNTLSVERYPPIRVLLIGLQEEFVPQFPPSALLLLRCWVIRFLEPPWLLIALLQLFFFVDSWTFCGESSFSDASRLAFSPAFRALRRVLRLVFRGHPSSRGSFRPCSTLSFPVSPRLTPPAWKFWRE